MKRLLASARAAGPPLELTRNCDGIEKWLCNDVTRIPEPPPFAGRMTWRLRCFTLSVGSRPIFSPFIPA